MNFSNGDNQVIANYFSRAHSAHISFFFVSLETKKGGLFFGVLFLWSFFEQQHRQQDANYDDSDE